jgi:hypothetical protein
MTHNRTFWNTWMIQYVQNAYLVNVLLVRRSLILPSCPLCCHSRLTVRGSPRPVLTMVVADMESLIMRPTALIITRQSFSYGPRTPYTIIVLGQKKKKKTALGSRWRMNRDEKDSVVSVFSACSVCSKQFRRWCKKLTIQKQPSDMTQDWGCGVWCHK